MANYAGYTRTNYFQVNDEEYFESILANCCSDEDTKLTKITMETEEGRKVGFCCEDKLLGYADDLEYPEYDLDAFYRDLQSLLPENDAILITEVGREKMRYLVGTVTVITHDSIQCQSLDEIGKEIARKQLGDSWNTINEY